MTINNFRDWLHLEKNHGHNDKLPKAFWTKVKKTRPKLKASRRPTKSFVINEISLVPVF